MPFFSLKSIIYIEHVEKVGMRFILKNLLTMSFAGVNVYLVVSSAIVCYPTHRGGECIDKWGVKYAYPVGGRIVTIDADYSFILPPRLESL